MSSLQIWKHSTNVFELREAFSQGLPQGVVGEHEDLIIALIMDLRSTREEVVEPEVGAMRN